jgi:hypothetical protein
MQIRHLTLVSMLALSAYVSPPPPPAPKTVSGPPRAAAMAPAPALTGDVNDWPLTPGDWTYSRDSRGSVGQFGASGRTAMLSLRCDVQTRRITLSREASAPAQHVDIRTSSMTKQLPAQLTGGTPAYVAAEIMSNDPILDAMAFSRGRILVEAEGQQPVILPSWAEIARIVEDCRE